MQTRFACGLAVMLLIAGSALAVASLQSAHGPYPGATGAVEIGGKPKEFDCTLCHDTNPVNTGGGKVEILGVPVVYTPGVLYPLTVRLRNTTTLGSLGRKWGFELTAVRRSDGNGAGTFVLPDPDTLQVVAGEGLFASRAYVEHTFIGTRTALAGPVEWHFSWQAPSTAEGGIHFFCAGNSADGTFDPGNDWIFTTRDSSVALGTVDVSDAFAARTEFAAPAPNPAAGPVMFAWTLPARAQLELLILDARGRGIRRLVSAVREAGPGRERWDGLRDDGTRAPDGVYFARLSIPAGGESFVRKVTLAR